MFFLTQEMIFKKYDPTESQLLLHMKVLSPSHASFDSIRTVSRRAYPFPSSFDLIAFKFINICAPFLCLSPACVRPTVRTFTSSRGGGIRQRRHNFIGSDCCGFLLQHKIPHKTLFFAIR